MAKIAKYTRQFPVVGTPTHKALLEDIAVEINDYQAKGVRAALDLLFGINDGDVEGVSGEAALANVPAAADVEASRLAALRETPEYQAVLKRAVDHIKGTEVLAAFPAVAPAI